MQKIRLGKKGPWLQPMGIGTWAWGDRLFWNYGQGYGKEDLRRAFESSLRAGITLFDTAEAYGLGNSERLLGEFAQGAGQPIFIASKCFPFPWRLSARTLKGALQRSLKRLGAEQIDLYQMHWPLPPVSLERWMHAMADALEQGLIKQIGVSNYNAGQLERAVRTLEKRGHSLASNQILFSLLKRGAELNGLLHSCKEMDVTVIAYSPLGQGLLTGKYTPDSPPGGRRAMRLDRPFMERAHRLAKAMKLVGENYGSKSPAQVALNWAMQKGTLVIPGAKNPRQAEENAGALGWALNEEDVSRLDELSSPSPA